jgi:hypothetical protein
LGAAYVEHCSLFKPLIFEIFSPSSSNFMLFFLAAEEMELLDPFGLEVFFIREASTPILIFWSG